MNWPRFRHFRRFDVIGHVDHVDNRILRGWAFSPTRPDQRLILDVLYDGIFLGQAFARAYRSDLAAHDIGDGNHAFVFHVPIDAQNASDPTKFVVSTAGPRRIRLPLPFQQHHNLKAQARLSAKPRTVLGGYIASLQEPAPPAEADEQGVRVRLEPLFQTDPDLNVSAFVAHISRKFGRDYRNSKPADIYDWYLQTYATERGALVAPLSSLDIAYLNHEIGPGNSIAMTMASIEPGLSESMRIHRWVAEECCRLHAEDCLTTGTQKSVLNKVVSEPRTPFPVSRFMSVIRSESAMLRRFSTKRRTDRISLYLLLAVMGIRNSWIFQFIPKHWLLQLIESDRVFVRAFRQIFGHRLSDHADVCRKHIKKNLLHSLSAAKSVNYSHANRLLGGARIRVAPTSVDVQFFGPFGRQFGLGESCKRVARAIASSSLTTNFVDYALGAANNHNREFELNAAKPARINIMHLNLEEIPEALAFMPDVFSRTPLIVLPYWELSKPAAAHELALKVIDEIWAASDFMTKVFSQTNVPVKWVGMSYDDGVSTKKSCNDFRRQHDITKAEFVFLTTADAQSWVQRKNTLDVVLAFLSAFPAHEPVRLIVKTQNLVALSDPERMELWTTIRRLCDSDHRIVFIEHTFDHDEQRSLLGACDCFVTLHRAEGLGLDALDCMSLGVPVVATAYSGVCDFCSPETAWMVEADIVAVPPGDYAFAEPGHVWAAPRKEAAVAALRSVFFDASGRARKAKLGRESLARFATSTVFAARIEAQILRWL